MPDLPVSDVVIPGTPEDENILFGLIGSSGNKLKKKYRKGYRKVREAVNASSLKKMYKGIKGRNVKKVTFAPDVMQVEPAAQAPVPRNKNKKVCSYFGVCIYSHAGKECNSC